MMCVSNSVFQRLCDALEEAGDRLLLLGQCSPYGSLEWRVNMRIAKMAGDVLAEARESKQ